MAALANNENLGGVWGGVAAIKMMQLWVEEGRFFCFAKRLSPLRFTQSAQRFIAKDAERLLGNQNLEDLTIWPHQ